MGIPGSREIVEDNGQKAGQGDGGSSIGPGLNQVSNAGCPDSFVVAHVPVWQ